MRRSLRQSSSLGRTSSSTAHQRALRRRKLSLYLSSAASFFAATLPGERASAITGIWSQPFGGNYTFDTDTNWIGRVVPSAADDVADFSRFNFQGGDFTISLAANRTIGQLTVGDLDTTSPVNFTFVSGPGGFNLATTTGLQPVMQIANLGFSGVSSKTVTISAPISGTAGFNKTGAGFLVLSGTSTYTGNTTITAGTLRAANGVAFGASTVALNGGTLDLRNDLSTVYGTPVTLLGNGQINIDHSDGGNANGNTLTIGAFNFGLAGATRTVTVTSYQSVNNGSSPLLDEINYTLATGVMTLNDSGNVNSNTSSQIRINGVTSAAANAATLTIGGSNGYAGNVTINGPVTEGAAPLAITFTNNRNLILSGPLAYTGGTNITGGGTITLGASTTLPPTGPVTITNGTLDLNNNSSSIGALTIGINTGTILTESGTLTFGGDVNYTGGSGSANLIGNFNFGATPRTFNILQGINNSGQADMTLNGPTGDAGGGFIKTGPGTLRLTGNSTATGMVTVSGGTLEADGLASGHTSLSSGGMNLTGGTLYFTNNNSSGNSGSTGALTFATNSSSGTLAIDSRGSGPLTLNLATITGRNAGATGVLTIVPNTGTLDGNDILTVTTSPTSLIVNGMLPAYIATQNSGGDTGLDFVNVVNFGGVNHVVTASATYVSSLTAGANAVVALNSGGDIGSNPNATTNVFGLKVNGNSVTGQGTLLIGSGSNPAGLILNNSASIQTSNLSFGSNEGVVWVGSGNSTISSAMTLASTMTTAGSGQLTLNGALTFNGGSNINVNGATVTISSTISAGNLTKTGPGYLVIAGNEVPYTGSMISNGGTLQIGDGNSSGTLSATSPLVANASIAFNRSDSVTINNPISGSGNVVQSGSGITTLNGVLTYTGNAVVVNGTMRSSDAGHLLPANSSLLVNGGTFDLAGGSSGVGLNQSILGVGNGATTGSITTSVFGNATLTLTGSGSFNGVIGNGNAGGTVNLVKSTGGTQQLNGFSTYTGNDFLNGGTLAIGGVINPANGAFISGQAGAGTIIFNGGTLANGALPNQDLFITNRLSVPAGNVGTILMGNQLELGSAATGTLTGAGILNIVANGTVTRDDLRGDFGLFTGTVNLYGSGTIRAGQQVVIGGVGSNRSIMNMPTAWLELNDSVNIQPNDNSGGNPYAIGALNSLSPTTVIQNPTGGVGSLEIGLLNKDSTFAGQIQGNNALVKVGNANLFLTNNNPYTNVTIVGTDSATLPGNPGGTLVIGSGGNLSGTGSITVNDSAALAIAGTGTISSAATLSLQGTGRFDVTNATNWSTPPRLTITGSNVAGAQPKVLSTGPYQHSAGTINPGAVGSAGTINFQNGLRFVGGTGAFDLTGVASRSFTLGNAVNDLIDVTGGLIVGLTQPTSAALRINFTSSPPNNANQTYPIFHYDTLTDTSGGAIADGATFPFWDIQGAAAGAYTLTNDAVHSELKLNFQSGPSSIVAITWTGAQTNVWENGSSKNWKDNTGTGTVFFLGDSVSFIDNNAPTNVTINTVMQPARVTVNASVSNYTFLAGTGGIGGTGTLIKDGIGTLTIGNSSSSYSYSGGTQLKGGVIDLNALNTLNTSTGNTPGTSQIAGSNLLLGTGSIQMSNNTTLIMGNFTGNNSGTKDALALPSVNLDAGASATIEMSQRGELGAVSSQSFVGSDGPAVLNIVGPGFVRGEIRADTSKFSGVVNVFDNPNVGTCDFRMNYNGVNNTTTLCGWPNATLNLNDPGVFAEMPAANTAFANGYQLSIGELTGKGTLSGGASAGNFTWNIGRNQNFEFDGNIINTSATAITNINKVGTSTATFTGQLLNTGTYTATAGTLKFDNSGGSLTVRSNNIVAGGGTGAATFMIGTSGATFTASPVHVFANANGNFDTGPGFSTPPNMVISGNGGTVWGNVTHNAGTIAAGAVDGQIGTLTFHDGLTVGGGAFVMDLRGGVATPAATDSDLINVNGQLDLNSGTILVSQVGSVGFTPGATYNIIHYGSETGSINNFSLGIRATATFNDDHVGNISLTINSVATTGANLSWTGLASQQTWDVAGQKNWVNNALPGGDKSDKFFNNDSVTFDDTATNYTVTLGSYNVTPAALVINNTNNVYRITGTGTISGGTSLIKKGTGQVRIDTQNTYTGGTQLQGGTLGFTSGAPFPAASTVTFTGGELALLQQPEGDPTQPGNTLTWGGAVLNIAAPNTGTINLVANNNFGSNAVASNGVQLFQQSIVAAGTLTGGGTVVFNTSNIAPQPIANNILIAPGVTNEVDELTDITMNAGAFTGTISFNNAGQYPASGALVRLGTTIRLGATMSAPSASWYGGNSGTIASTGNNVNIAMGSLVGGPNLVLKGFEGVSTSNAGTAGTTYTIGSLSSIVSNIQGPIIDGTGTAGTQATTITKVGAGNLLLSGTSTFTGNLNVNAGTVTFASSAVLGTPTINLGGGTLNVSAVGGNQYTATNAITGNGNIVGNVNHLGGTLQPGTVGTQGTLSFSGNYSVSSGTFNIDLGLPGGNTLGGATGSDVISIPGTLSYTGSNTVNFNFTQVPQLGTYSFMSAGHVGGTGVLVPGNFGLRPGNDVTLNTTAGGITQLVVTNIGAKTIKWGNDGLNTGTWDTSNTSVNWQLASDLTTHTAFFNLDTVIFDDTVFPKNGSVGIGTIVTPTAVIVTNSAFPYFFNSSGVIAGGATTLTKNGTSTLTIAQTGTNTYAGGTIINAGTIDTTTRGSLAIGTGTVTFAGGALTATSVGFTNAMTVGSTVTGTIALNGGGGVALNGAMSGVGTFYIQSDTSPKTITLGGSNTAFGGQVLLAGVQTMLLGSTNSFSGGAIWNLAGGGTLSTTVGNTTSATTGTLGALTGSANSTLIGSGAGAIVYQIGDALTTATSSATFAGAILDGLNGTTIRPVSITKSGAGIQTLSGTNTYTGATQINAGTLVLAGSASWTPALTGSATSTTGGTVIVAGRLVLDYSAGGTSPAQNVRTILGNEASTLATGQIRTTNPVDGQHGIGFTDANSKVTIGYAYRGDATMDGSVTTADFTVLAQNFNTTGSIWGQGDFNYDGVVNAFDFNYLATNFGITPPLPAPPALSGPSLIGALVPEPSTVALLAGVAALGARRRRRR